jgi:hypothetical protein
MPWKFSPDNESCTRQRVAGSGKKPCRCRVAANCNTYQFPCPAPSKSLQAVRSPQPENPLSKIHRHTRVARGFRIGAGALRAGVGSDQGELFGAVVAAERPGRLEAGDREVVHRRGRLVGAKTTISLPAVRWYLGKHGDPLERGIAVTAMPILAPGVLEALSQRLQMTTRGDAAKWWSSVLSAVLPFTHARPHARQPAAWRSSWRLPMTSW